MDSFSDSSGVLSKLSPYNVTETVDLLDKAVRAHSGTVFARIDQQAQAESAGLTLRPTQILFFGDPRIGTPLMQSHPLAALDLPLKAVAWQAEDGEVWLTCNSPEYLQQRHGLPLTAFAGIGGLIDEVLGT